MPVRINSLRQSLQISLFDQWSFIILYIIIQCMWMFGKFAWACIKTIMWLSRQLLVDFYVCWLKDESSLLLFWFTLRKLIHVPHAESLLFLFTSPIIPRYLFWKTPSHNKPVKYGSLASGLKLQTAIVYSLLCTYPVQSCLISNST